MNDVAPGGDVAWNMAASDVARVKPHIVNFGKEKFY